MLHRMPFVITLPGSSVGRVLVDKGIVHSVSDLHVCMYVDSIMAVHPEGMGRYSAPARYILLPASAPVQKPTVRPAYPLSNAMLNIGNK